jgi:hypothetical protein
MDILGSIISNSTSYLKGVSIPVPNLFGSDDTVKNDVELEESLEYRTSKRTLVLNEVKRLPLYDKYLDACKLPPAKRKDFESFVTNEFAWWDDKNNYNKEKKVYRIRITQFMDALEIRKKDLQVLATEQLSLMEPKDAQAIMNDPEYKDVQMDVTPEFFENEPIVDMNSTPYTIFLQVLSDILPWAKFILFLAIAFRLSSITANELLYKHVSYRILAFVYIFYYVLYSSTFSIPIIIYYLYKEYSNFLFKGTMDYPIYYSAFPIQRVVTLENPPVYSKWYQYPHTADEWIQRKKISEHEAMLLAIQGTKDILRALMTQGGNVDKMKQSLGVLTSKIGHGSGNIQQRRAPSQPPPAAAVAPAAPAAPAAAPAAPVAPAPAAALATPAAPAAAEPSKPI